MKHVGFLAVVAWIAVLGMVTAAAVAQPQVSEIVTVNKETVITFNLVLLCSLFLAMITAAVWFVNDRAKFDKRLSMLEERERENSSLLRFLVKERGADPRTVIATGG